MIDEYVFSKFGIVRFIELWEQSDKSLQFKTTQ